MEYSLVWLCGSLNAISRSEKEKNEAEISANIGVVFNRHSCRKKWG